MKQVGHVMILASAGSGKTYALTNRFVRLLALGAKPERIVALTFTRKAAGEFFDEILNKLARAATDADYATQLAGEIEEPALSTDDFRSMLRRVVDAMHRLRLGTLDGFFARIARNFPFELGLTGEFELLQEHSAQIERARVLRQMFQHGPGAAPAQREFIEAFKRATFGAEEKRLGAQLDAFIDRYQEVFARVQGKAAWGNPDRIWPAGAEWRGRATRRESAAQSLRAALMVTELTAKQRVRLQAFFIELDGWLPGAPMGAALEYVLKNALKAWPDFAEIVVDRRKLILDTAARQALREIVLALMAAEMDRRLAVTRGIRDVLAAYERTYHDAVRRAGKLTFSDVQRLLEPDNGAPLWTGRANASGSGEDLWFGPDELPFQERRIAIDYRLDGEIDHWLLDEFQDTSFGQWSVLKNLIDEAVQDPTGTRSFFYVGDVKQAIFAWREGDPRLFREIFDDYNAIQPGTIAEEHLVRSWRSGPAVIEAVNQVFGDAAVLRDLFPGPAAESWIREWRAHESARPQLASHVALLHASDEMARFAVTLSVLHEIAPIERGLSCAVLVQDNSTAMRLADYLRREGGLPAIAESDLHVCTDNPLGAALLALVKAAAHPGDRLAQEHIRMTPLGGVLRVLEIDAPEGLTRAVLRQIYTEGFEATVRSWIERLLPVLAENDEFNRERARQFAAAASLFDATGSRDVAEFVAFMERHTIRDTDAGAALRVMTIHKSKGLGFDLVLLPDLEGIRLDCRREGLAVQKAADRSVEWVLDLPGKLFHAQDPVLAAHVAMAEADACYESLALLYVAMTRAKQGMYLITKPPGNSTSRNFPKLLAETLGGDASALRIGRTEFAGAYAGGDEEWFLRSDQRTIEGDDRALPQPMRLEREPVRRTARLVARTASARRTAQFTAAQLFSLGRERNAEFGSAVHNLLAEVEWAETLDVTRIAAEWRSRGEPAEIVDEAAACLRAKDLAHVWRPRANGEVWRERTFEIVIDGVWVTGTFDRVIVDRDGHGKAHGAVVFDFKTDRVKAGDDLGSLAARHRHQVEIYRRAAARLTGLAEAEVPGELIFTRVQRCVRLRDGAGLTELRVEG